MAVEQRQDFAAKLGILAASLVNEAGAILDIAFQRVMEHLFAATPPVPLHARHNFYRGQFNRASQDHGARAISPVATTLPPAPSRSRSAPRTARPTALPRPNAAGSKARSRVEIPRPSNPADGRASGFAYPRRRAARPWSPSGFHRIVETPPPRPEAKRLPPAHSDRACKSAQWPLERAGKRLPRTT